MSHLSVTISTAEASVMIVQPQPSCFDVGVEKWKFFDFLVKVRTIVYPLVKSYVVTSLLSVQVDSELETAYQSTVRQHVHSIPSHIHKTHLLEEFARELDTLRKDLAQTLCKWNPPVTHTPTSCSC